MFVLAYHNTTGDNQVSVESFKNKFLPRVKIEDYNIEINGRTFYDQPINGSINNTMKLQKYQQGKVLITQLAVCWITNILKGITD